MHPTIVTALQMIGLLVIVSPVVLGLTALLFGWLFPSASHKRQASKPKAEPD